MSHPLHSLDSPRSIPRLLPLILVSLASVLPAAAVASADDEPASIDAPRYDPISYFIGMSVGQNMRQNGFVPDDFNDPGFLAGFKDGIGKKEAVLTDEQLRETQRRITQMLDERLRAPGLEYLNKIKDERDVSELSGGLLYESLESGDGQSPGLTDTVTVHYTGKLIDGQVFDSSVQRDEPARFRVNQVIKGWQIALTKMRVGDKWMIYIPSDLAYGRNGSPPKIGPHSVLTFEVELLGIQ